MRGAILGLFLAGLAVDPLAADPADEAFARGAYLEAREIWQEAADEGDPAARFNLGVLYDLGLGVERDSARAFEQYRRAAASGHGEAQFNVAVMIDAGTVGAADPTAAAVWYARAAANGVPRAAYNLGLLYLGGTGVARNADLARYWLGQAEEAVPAARDALDRIEPAEPATDLATPEPQGGVRVDLPDGTARAELVWTAPPDASTTPFVVQIAELAAEGTHGSLAPQVETPASSVSVALEEAKGTRAWRVLKIAPDGESYVASRWSPLEPGAAQGHIPRGAVRFLVGAEDPDARRLAEAMADVLAANDLLVRIEEITSAVSAPNVRYGFETDAPLAQAIAELLPGLAAGSAETGSAEDLVPGQVTVALAGGLAADPAQSPASQTSTPASAGGAE